MIAPIVPTSTVIQEEDPIQEALMVDQNHHVGELLPENDYAQTLSEGEGQEAL